MRPAFGHLYTIARHLADRAWPPQVPNGDVYSVDVADPNLGSVPIRGVLHRPAGAKRLVALVHGLGGSIESGYMRRMTAAALARGHAVLRLNLRGADRSGSDIYHAGLTADLRAALASEMIADLSPRVVIGFSLGGHMSLRYGGEPDADIDALVAVCSPLDLAASARFIDSPRRVVYCRHLLRGLLEIYERSEPAIGAIVGMTTAESRELKTIRAWDERIVARRFGFADADDYYARATAIPFLEAIKVPTLMVRAEQDPMVSLEAAALDRVRDAELWRLDGGHLGFPRRTEFEARVLDWVDATVGE